MPNTRQQAAVARRGRKPAGAPAGRSVIDKSVKVNFKTYMLMNIIKTQRWYVTELIVNYGNYEFYDCI